MKLVAGCWLLVTNHLQKVIDNRTNPTDLLYEGCENIVSSVIFTMKKDALYKSFVNFVISNMTVGVLRKGVVTQSIIKNVLHIFNQQETNSMAKQ